MGLVKKSLRRDENLDILEKKLTIQEINTKEFKGTVCLMKILKVKQPFIVKYEAHSITVLDNNYLWLQLAPENKNWWLTVLYDDKENLLESYFDITKENNFTDPLNPTFIDMRLDITISKERGVKLLDEDELKDALMEHLISLEEYNMAYQVSNQILQSYSKNSKAYYAFIQSLFEQLKKKKEFSIIQPSSK